MCGITGWISFDRDLRTERDTVDAMTETMDCRGPDDRGTWISGPAALGHRRLAIIDLPGGRQPMTARTDEGSVVLVYSGETYNFTELRAELAARATGSPPSPTPRSCCAAIWSGARPSRTGSTACTRSPSGTSRSGAW